MNKSFSQQWLATLCSFIPGVHSAMFVVPDREKNLIRPLASLPANLEQPDDFLDIVKYTLKKRQQSCFPKAQTKDGQAFDLFSIPISIKSRMLGIIVIKVKHLSTSHHPAVFKVMKQGARWLKLGGVNNTQDESFYSSVVGLLAACFEQQSYHQGLIRIVTELTRNLSCERVAFSEFRSHHCQVVALSNSANFDDRSNLIQKIADAMDEAIEQDSAIVFPDPKSRLVQRAHQDLARKFGAGSLCSIPLIHEQKVFGGHPAT